MCLRNLCVDIVYLWASIYIYTLYIYEIGWNRMRSDEIGSTKSGWDPTVPICTIYVPSPSLESVFQKGPKRSDCCSRPRRLRWFPCTPPRGAAVCLCVRRSWLLLEGSDYRSKLYFLNILCSISLLTAKLIAKVALIYRISHNSKNWKNNYLGIL